AGPRSGSTKRPGLPARLRYRRRAADESRLRPRGVKIPAGVPRDPHRNAKATIPRRRQSRKSAANPPESWSEIEPAVQRAPPWAARGAQSPAHRRADTPETHSRSGHALPKRSGGRLALRLSAGLPALRDAARDSP